MCVSHAWKSQYFIEQDAALPKLKALAEGGDNAAQLTLADYYEDDEIPANYNPSEAMRLYQASADQGNPHAQYRLGMMYYWGEIVTRDLTEAFKWIRKAAAQNYSQAQGMEKTIVYIIGTIANAKAANAEAEYELGELYLLGAGVQQSDVEAMDWWHKAADQGYPDAIFRVARSFEREGRMTPQEMEDALFWLNLAGKAGDKEGYLIAHNMESWVPAEQISAAYTRVHEWQAAHPNQPENGPKSKFYTDLFPAHETSDTFHAAH